MDSRKAFKSEHKDDKDRNIQSINEELEAHGLKPLEIWSWTKKRNLEIDHIFPVNWSASSNTEDYSARIPE